MYFDVLIDGKSYGFMDESNIHIHVEQKGKQNFSSLEGSFVLPARFEGTLEFDLPLEHQLHNFFMEKHNEIYSSTTLLNYKFDISTQIYNSMDDFYAFDYGHILMGVNDFKGCFVEEINFTYEKCKAKLCFDYIQTTSYF